MVKPPPLIESTNTFYRFVPEQAPVGFSLYVALMTDPLYNVSPIFQDIYLMPYDHFSDLLSVIDQLLQAVAVAPQRNYSVQKLPSNKKKTILQYSLQTLTPQTHKLCPETNVPTNSHQISIPEVRLFSRERCSQPWRMCFIFWGGSIDRS